MNGFYHAVGLGDAGKAAQGKKTKHQKRLTVLKKADTAGNFQKTAKGILKQRAFAYHFRDDKQ